MEYYIRNGYKIPFRDEELSQYEQTDKYYENLFRETMKNLQILRKRYDRVHADYHAEIEINKGLEFKIKELTNG